MSWLLLAPKLHCVSFTSINSLRLTHHVKSAFFVLTCSKFVTRSKNLVVIGFRDDLVGTSSRFYVLDFLALHNFESIQVSFLLVLVSLMLLSVELGVFLVLSPENEDRDNEQKQTDGREDEAHALPEHVVISI